jgi:uncharacterized membrane protein YqiK
VFEVIVVFVVVVVVVVVVITIFVVIIVKRAKNKNQPIDQSGKSGKKSGKLPGSCSRIPAGNASADRQHRWRSSDPLAH